MTNLSKTGRTRSEHAIITDTDTDAECRQSTCRSTRRATICAIRTTTVARYIRLSTDVADCTAFCVISIIDSRARRRHDDDWWTNWIDNTVDISESANNADIIVDCVLRIANYKCVTIASTCGTFS